MSTKYVLNSGGIRNNSELKKKFHRELIEGLRPEPKFLLCNFGQGREYWEDKFEGYSASIAEDMPDDVRPTFELAMPATFSEQSKNADVIYIHGGDDHLMQYWLKQLDVPATWEGKVVATNSGSSDAITKSYWTCDWRECGDGLGILPIKFLPHYLSDFGTDDPRGPIDWEQAKRELEEYGDTSLPVYALKESEFEVFEV